jgi:N-acetyl-anhydromuramyl-L-alanine amidase AmpD
VEKPPTSRLGSEPAFDETAVPGNAGGTETPPPPPKPVGPPLQGPTTSLSPSNSGQVAQGAAQRVRRASLSQRLRAYLDDASASELLYPNKADRPWQYIVLHHSAARGGNYDQIDVEHRKVLGFEGCGYHFVIGNGTGSGDGQIEVAQRWTNQKQGVHCRNAREHEVDEYGIGICLVGDLDKEPPTPRQIAAAQALIAYLSNRYAINQNRIASHARVAATETVCPGKHFPSEAILTVHREAMGARPVPTSWRVVRESKTSY